MNTSKTMMCLLAAAATCASPAYANWFSNPHTNTNLNVGSAPNPTPEDLRAIGDSPYATGPARGPAIPHSSGHYGEPALHSSNGPAVLYGDHSAYELHGMTDVQMTALEGKPVLGAHRARLGYVLAVDHASRMAEVQTPSGIAVAIPVMLLSDEGNHIVAPTTSRADMMAMAKTQTGRTIAVNVDMRMRSFRG